MASVGLFHRTKRVAGQAKHLQGHCYVFAAHLYKHAAAKLPMWASALVEALMYVKGRSIPTLVARWPSNCGCRKRCGTSGWWIAEA